jgi:dipeptidyl aminopeptidase/acylaminoacyl peptidase
MRISQRRILCAAVMCCVLRLADTEAIACQPSASGSVQTEPTLAGPHNGAKPNRPAAEEFLVQYKGCWLLGANGEEKEYLSPPARVAVSPDGCSTARSEYVSPPRTDERPGWLVIQSRNHPEVREVVPLICGNTRSTCRLLWSSDSRRILICEQAYNENGSRRSEYRVYDLASKSLMKLRLHSEWAPSDWSADGKRLLTTLRTENRNRAVAWVQVDGTGKPEYLTSDQEMASGAKLSPDNQRILCQIWSPGPKNQAIRARLYVIDLTSKKRTMIDRPGYTDSYCWSSDGSKVAYTWQLPLRRPEEVAERRAYLVTCDLDGGNRKTVTMRKYDVTPDNSEAKFFFTFFEVLAWWR